MKAARERGAGTVLALAGVGVVLLLTVAGLALGSAAAAAHSARAAADLAALAAASALQNGGGDPCAIATALARRNSAELTTCETEAGDAVRITVAVPQGLRWPGTPPHAIADARAGPDDAGQTP